MRGGIPGASPAAATPTGALGTDGSAASVATAYARVPAQGDDDQEVSDQHPFPSTRYVSRVEPPAQLLDPTPRHSQGTPAPSPPSSPGIDECGCSSLCAYLRRTGVGRWMSNCLCCCCECEGLVGTPVPSDDSSAEAEAGVASLHSVDFELLRPWPRVLMPTHVLALMNEYSGVEGWYQPPAVVPCTIPSPQLLAPPPIRPPRSAPSVTSGELPAPACPTPRQLRPPRGFFYHL